MPRLIRPRKLMTQRRPLSETSWSILRNVDQALADKEVVHSKGYRSLRAILSGVPHAERGVDWTERVVALYCAFEMKIPRCAALKIAIGDYRRARAETEAMDAFNKRLLQITAPKVLTGHGLQLPFSHRDQDEILKDLIELIDLLKTLGYEAFINSGTLLGAVREGGFLGHDDDADLAVLIDGQDDEEVVRSMLLLRDKLNECGKLLAPAWFHPKSPFLNVLVGSGIEVDLFPLWFRQERAYLMPHTYGELSRDDIFPLARQPLCGTDLPAPRHAEKMLAVNYGEGWRFPDPNYVFPWGEGKKRFASVLETFARYNKPPSLFSRIFGASKSDKP